MDAREDRDKQRESESDRKRQIPDLHLDDRIFKNKIELYGQKFQESTKYYEVGQLTKSVAEVGPTSKECDGNDRDGNEELNIKHPFSESIDAHVYGLPLEILDVILKKSYLHWVLNSSTEQSDEEFVESLTSVDVCFSLRITRQRFKKTIWRYLKNFYGKTKEKHAIIRSNIIYLENNIQPNDELISSLLHLNCITEEQGHFIQRQRSTRDKNYELLYVTESFDEKKFSTFVNCLRRTNQRTVANIIENGGGVIKIQVKTLDAGSMETKINNLRDRTKPRSHQTDQLIVQLRKEGIEILSSQLDGQTVIVWIRCHSQTAFENLQKMYKSNHLRDEYFDNIQPSTSKVISIDRNQFKKTVVVRPITIDFLQRNELPANQDSRGVTKLRNEIYVLCYSDYRCGIHVFEDQNSFRSVKYIETEEIKYPSDIASCEKENCLYVIDSGEQCVWKITRETDDQHKTIKWLTIVYEPLYMSVTGDGELLLINRSSHSKSPHHLMIYGSDAELIRSIPLTRDIENPQHAVETSIGNFIITHRQVEKQEEKDEDKGKDEDEVVMAERKHTKCLESRDAKGESRRMTGMTSDISELTRDGQMVICRFIPPHEIRQSLLCRYLLIDSDGRVFAVDDVNRRVILLDSDLKLNRILCPTREEKRTRISLVRVVRSTTKKRNN